VTESKKHKVSIVIRCFNEEKHIGKLLKGIDEQVTDHDVETIIVDSGSTDKTVEIAKSYNARIIDIKPEEFSFGYALNVGCENATGDYLLFASAHVYPVYTTWVQEMIRPLLNNRVALCYGRQIGNELTKYSEHQLFKRWFPAESDFNQNYPFCNNANCAIKKELWQEQKYDELLTGLEDLDWAKKIQSKGYRIAYNADATIVHVHEETPSRIFNRYRREAIALKQIFPNEKFSFLDFLKLFVGNTIADYYHAIAEGQFTRNIFDIPMFRFNQFRGTYKGYRQNKIVSKSLRNRFYYPNALSKMNHDDENKKYIIQY